MKVYFAFLLAAVIALPAFAHPGKTDRYGGHKCYKECAEWDLYYAEYHLHDKDGRAVKTARKKPAGSGPEAAPVEEKAVPEERSADTTAEATTSLPIAAAAAAVEPAAPSLPWMFILLFLLLMFAVRRKRRRR